MFCCSFFLPFFWCGSVAFALRFVPHVGFRPDFVLGLGVLRTGLGPDAVGFSCQVSEFSLLVGFEATAKTFAISCICLKIRVLCEVVGFRRFQN